MIDFDFHEIALSVPLLAFSLSALVRRRPLAAIGWAMPLVFVKEDQGFTVAAIGPLIAAIAVFPSLLPGPGRGLAAPDGSWAPRGWRRLASGTAAAAGLGLAAWGLLWSVLAITVIIPHFNPLHVYYFWKDGGAVGGGQSFSVAALLVQLAHGWPVKLTDGRDAAAADGVRRARLAGRAGRAAQPGAAVHLGRHGVLGHRLALQTPP